MAFENLSVCCETLCDKATVIKYINQLEFENAEIKGQYDRLLQTYNGLLNGLTEDFSKHD
jgi:hypothetical protein